MSLKMSSPTKNKFGVYRLKQRLPADLQRLRGQFVTLPVVEQSRTVKIGEMIELSLQTTEAGEAKKRFRIAEAALADFFGSHRAAGSSLVSYDSENTERQLGDLLDEVLDNERANTKRNRRQIVDEFVGIMNAANVKIRDSSVSVDQLWEKWKEGRGKSCAKNTLKRYQPVLQSLHRFCGKKDIRGIDHLLVHKWANHRVEYEGVSRHTVKTVDLVAVSSVFGWATRSGGELSLGFILSENPVRKIDFDAPAPKLIRERCLRDAEVATILSMARTIKPDDTNPTASAAKRWCPWLCAYTGARISELTALHKKHIRFDQDAWVIDLRVTKTGLIVSVPIHEHLIEEGFLDFQAASDEGPLFYDPKRHRAKADTKPWEQRSKSLARWIRAAIKLDPFLEPNHCWRHTFKTRAEGVGIDADISDAITGHSDTKVAGRYRWRTIPVLEAAIKQFPRYKV